MAKIQTGKTLTMCNDSILLSSVLTLAFYLIATEEMHWKNSNPLRPLSLLNLNHTLSVQQQPPIQLREPLMHPCPRHRLGKRKSTAAPM